MYQGLGGRGEGRGSVVGGGGQLIKLYITSSTVFIFCTVRPIKIVEEDNDISAII